jgi:hypothetical protein
MGSDDDDAGADTGDDDTGDDDTGDDDTGDDDAGADDDCEGDDCYFDLDGGADDDTGADAGPGGDGGAPEGDGGTAEGDGGTWGDGGSDEQEAIDELGLPEYPAEDEVDETVGGVDDNENGLRDDVERDLGVKYWPDKELIQVINEIIKDDGAMIGNPDDSDIVSDSLERKKLAIGCLELHFEGDLLKVLEITGDIAAHVLDTPERLAAARAVDSKLGGQVITLPTDPEIERFCEGLWVPDLAVDPAEAATENNAACRTTSKTVVTYSNGLLQRHDKAIVNGMALRQVTRNNEGENSNYVYKLAFNDSESTYALSGQTEMYGEFTTLSDLIAQSPEWMAAFNHYQSGAGSMPEWVKASLESSTGPVFTVSADDTPGQVAAISSDITVGNRVFLVGHGTGALAANAAYDGVVASLPDVGANLRVVAVGTPAGSIAGDSAAANYVTLEEDLIVFETLAGSSGAGGDAGAPTSAALPGNATNATDTEPTGHEFLQSYVRGDAAGPALQALIDAAIAEVEAPEAIATDGIITVTLTWGEQPDVDLHAFEPDGTHVFYQALQGMSGALDLDDVSSFGPEHYTVSCNTLVAGTYEIGVNYFSGSGPETATVNVEAGSQSRTFTVGLTTAVASSGNNTPIPVANIVVTEGDSGFEFQIVDTSMTVETR